MSRHQLLFFDMSSDISGSAMTVKLNLDRQPYALMFACLGQLLALPVLADLDIVWRHVTAPPGLVRHRI